MAKTRIPSIQIKNFSLQVEDLKDFAPEDGGDLNLNIKAGRIRNDNTLTDTSAQVVALTDNITNFVELDTLGVASDNTTGFTAGSIPIAIVVTSGADITGVTDKRAWIVITGNKDISTRVFNSSNVSIANSTRTAIPFPSERFDTDTIHDTVTNNTRLTAKTAGKYYIFGFIRWAANNTGFREALIKLNNITFIGGDRVPTISGANVYQDPNCMHILAVNDYVELIVFQTSGGSLNVDVNGVDFHPDFGMIKMA